MRDVVDLRHEGWYGSRHLIECEKHLLKKPVDCKGLSQHTLRLTNKIFVKICHEIEGTFGRLVVNKNYTPEKFTLPINRDSNGGKKWKN